MTVALIVILFVILVGWCVHVCILEGRLERSKNETVAANRRNYELQARLPDDMPTCLCNHGVNFHSEGNGGCEKLLRDYEEYLSFLPFIRRAAMCECKRYVGPEPLPTYYFPELTA